MSNENDNTKWFVVQTKAKQEFIAEHNLNHQGFETFLPVAKGITKRRRATNSTLEAFFPGYLFIALEAGVQNISPIRSTRGVIGLVRNGQSLAPVPVPVLEALKQMQHASNGVIEWCEIFKAGDEVVISEGAMAGLKAIFKSKASKERVILLLNILGSQQEVMISQHCLTKAV